MEKFLARNQPTAYLLILMLLFILPLCPFPAGLSALQVQGDFEVGFRRDYVMWELAGYRNLPPVLSRLTWKDLNSVEGAVQFKTITEANLYLRSKGSYGQICEGRNRDSDYFQVEKNGPIIEFSRSENKAGKGYVWDICEGIGCFFHSSFYDLKIAPLIGYSIHRQHLTMYEGYQKISLIDPPSEGRPIRNLDSHYRTLWYGPWIGLDLYYTPNEALTYNLAIEYHYMRYHGAGHWNLRRDFVGKFHHLGHGSGVSGHCAVDYKVKESWCLGANFCFNYAQISNGRDYNAVFVTEDATSVIRYFKGKLRTIEWSSLSLALSLAYNF